MKVLRLKPGVVLANAIPAMGRELVPNTLSKLLAQLQEDGEELWVIWRQKPEALADQRTRWPEIEAREMLAHWVGGRYAHLYGSSYRTNYTQRQLRQQSRQMSLVGFYAMPKSARESLYEEAELEDA